MHTFLTPSRLLALSSALLLSACNLTKPTYQASVDLLHASAKNGRLNHSDYELGRVLRLDRRNLRLTEVSAIPLSGVPLQRVPADGEQAADTLDTLTQYDISLTSPTGTPVVDAALTSQVAAHFRCDLQNYHTLQPDIDTTALANDKSTLQWRLDHKDKLIGGGTDGSPSYLNNPNYLYAIVNKVYYASSTEITTGAPDGSDGKPGNSLSTQLTLGGKNLVNLSYKHQTKATRTGDKIPAIVNYDLYLLKPTPEGHNGAGIMFTNINNLYSETDPTYQQIQHAFAQALRNSRTVE